MKVIKLIEDAVSSDIRQLALANIGTESNRGSNTEQADNLKTLVSFVNQGLLDLYTRFPLSVKSIEADADAIDQSIPIILPNDALGLKDVVVLETEESLPIDSSAAEFKFDKKGEEIMYVKTLAVNTYLVKGHFPSSFVELRFDYYASPKEVALDDELPLPVLYNEALRLFIAYRAYSTIKSVTQTGDEHIKYKKMYEDACNLIKGSTEAWFDFSNAERLSDRGFV